MKEIEKLIEKWKLELHFYTSAYNTSNVYDIKNYADRTKAIAILLFIIDLKELSEKLNRASKRSSNVIENEESKESKSFVQSAKDNDTLKVKLKATTYKPKIDLDD